MAGDANYLTPLEAARYLGLSTRTLSRYRSAGEGPAFHLFGARVRYLRADLDGWAAARRWTSTAEAGTARKPDTGSAAKRRRADAGPRRAGGSGRRKAKAAGPRAAVLRVRGETP